MAEMVVVGDRVSTTIVDDRGTLKVATNNGRVLTTSATREGTPTS